MQEKEARIEYWSIVVNRMRKLIYTVALLALTSCVYQNMYHFEEGDLDWMSPYNVGDTIRFETSKGVDMLCINEKVIDDTHNPFVKHEGELWGDYHAYGEYEGKFIHKYSDLYFYMRVYKCANGKLDFYICLGERYCFTIPDNDIKNRNKKSTSIKDTLIIDDTNSHYGQAGPLADDFEYIKWSKKEGLIGYRLRDGTVYPKP